MDSPARLSPTNRGSGSFRSRIKQRNGPAAAATPSSAPEPTSPQSPTLNVDYDAWIGLLEPRESLILTKAFSVEESAAKVRIGVIDFDAMRNLFCSVGATMSPGFLDGIASEVPNYATHSYTLADVHHIYASWKMLTQQHSQRTKSWAESSYVKKATATKLMLVDTTPRSLWNLFYMFVAMVHFYIIVTRDGSEGLSRKPVAGYLVIDWLFSVIYTVNIVLMFNSVKVTKHGIIDCPRTVRIEYLKSWLLFDILGALPLDAILSHSGASTASAVVSHFRVLNCIRSVFLWGISGYIPLTQRYIRFYFQFLPLLRLFYAFVGVTVLFAALFILVKNQSGRLDDLGDFKTVTSWYFIIQVVTTVGYGDIRVEGAGEMWYTIIVLCCGLLLNGLIIGRLVMLLQLVDAGTLRQDKLRETLAVLQYFEIPQQLQIEILNFQSHVLWSSLGTAFNHLTSTLPASMNENIELLQRMEVLKILPALSGATEVVMTCLACELVSETYKPEEYISWAGETHKGVRFVLFGFVDKIDNKGHYSWTYRSGDYFGYENLLDLLDETHNFKALSYCDLLILPAESFHSVMKRFPAFAAKLRSEARRAELPNVLVDGNPHSGMPRAQAASNARRAQSLHMLFVKLRGFKEKLIAIRDAGAPINGSPFGTLTTSQNEVITV